jgi:DNA-binding transcriptional regulator YdaS (Cro superfamily)
MITETEKEAFAKALEIVGGQTALAIKCGVRQQTVFCWKKMGIPWQRVKQIHEATGCLVPKEQLKPEMYE